MKILGIETSCDETAVCLIEASGDFEADFTFKVLGNALYSQVAIHAPYGGVFPNLAKREHAKNLVPLMQQALKQANMLEQGSTLLKDSVARSNLAQVLAREPELLEQLTGFLERYEKPGIDCIAVTHGPGLEPALWVGVNFARALSLVWDVPIVAVNHMEGHIMMSMVQQETRRELEGQTFQSTGRSDLPDLAASYKLSAISFPLLSLLISGGHTELVLSREFMQYERIGETRDDAAGEAFDKVARLLDLPYPGGPQISRLAAEARKSATMGTMVSTMVPMVALPRPMIHEDNYDFSFSGLKTAVKRVVEAHAPLSDEQKMELVREFEDAVADVLIAKTLRAAEEYGVQTVLVGGGVSANEHVRAELARALTRLPTADIQLLLPPPDLATDNAIMIALAGYFHAIKKEFADAATLRANGNLRLG